MIVSLFTRLLDFISPRTCTVCGCRLAVTEEDICAVCNIHLPRTDYAKRPYDNPLAKTFWGLMPIERATALFFYKSHAASSLLIYALKYHNKPEVGVTMGRMAASELLPTGFFNDIDAIVPIPLSKKRRRQRGYNQSEEIAQGLNEITGIPLVTKAVERTKFNTSQTHLFRWERQENVAGMFRLGKEGSQLADKHVLIVDDVITTGATILSCAEALKDIPNIKFSVFSLGFSKR